MTSRETATQAFPREAEADPREPETALNVLLVMQIRRLNGICPK